MRLDSVRELKARLIHELVLRPMAAARRLDARALPLPALGIAKRSRGDYRLAVRVRKPPEAMPIVDLIAEEARGEADIRFVGAIHPMPAPKDPPARLAASHAWVRRRQRPLIIGCSVGHAAASAGTIGCFVRPSGGSPKGLMLLSNNHILALENAARRGDPIVQPGIADGGQMSRDTVARLARRITLRPGRTNRADAACAALIDNAAVEPGELRGLGSLNRRAAEAVDIGQEVAKIGRTTGLTRGRVTAIELDNVLVDYDLGRVRFDDQIEVEGLRGRPFSLGGDSGALVVTENLEPAALLFAGSERGGSSGRGLTYATPIQVVFQGLRVDLAV